jgi:hypothetical protein
MMLTPYLPACVAALALSSGSASSAQCFSRLGHGLFVEGAVLAGGQF